MDNPYRKSIDHLHLYTTEFSTKSNNLRANRCFFLPFWNLIFCKQEQQNGGERRKKLKVQQRRENDNNYVHKLYDKACPKDSQFVFLCTQKYSHHLINP